MTNTEKNRFIVEKVLQGCWHEFELRDNGYFVQDYCVKCNKFGGRNMFDFYSTDPDEQAINFFRLWNCIKGEEWFDEFIDEDILVEKTRYSETYEPIFLPRLINCSTLADVVVDYLRGGEDD